jgi:hypothetical protein
MRLGCIAMRVDGRGEMELRSPCGGFEGHVLIVVGIVGNLVLNAASLSDEVASGRSGGRISKS